MPMSRREGKAVGRNMRTRAKMLGKFEADQQRLLAEAARKKAEKEANRRMLFSSKAKYSSPEDQATDILEDRTWSPLSSAPSGKYRKRG